jgi:hypothetical protein
MQYVLDSEGSYVAMDMVRIDDSSDEEARYVAITCRRDVSGRPVEGEVLLLGEGDEELHIVWRIGGLNPWKLETADVDGDGMPEVIVGVWKTSPFDPVMANRLFVYSPADGELQPKWLGSRLSRRFDDFVFCDINSDGWDELIALEVNDEGAHRVAVYRWSGFGFDWLGCSDESDGIRWLYVRDGIPVAATESGDLSISLDNGAVTLR